MDPVAGAEHKAATNRGARAKQRLASVATERHLKLTIALRECDGCRCGDDAAAQRVSATPSSHELAMRRLWPVGGGVRRGLHSLSSLRWYQWYSARWPSRRNGANARLST